MRRELTEEQKWMLASAGSALVAAFVARVATESGWKFLRRSDPPKNPGDAATTWPEAIAWGLGSGMIVGVARVLAERAATSGWRRITGKTPRPLRW